VTPVPPAVTTVSLDEFLRGNPQKTDTKVAFGNLFKLWNTPYTAGNERACEVAEDNGLFCLLDEGSMAQVQMLNHPAILALTDSSGRQHQVVLAATAETTAEVQAGTDQLTVSLDELMTLWNGEFLLLWKPPTGTVKSFKPGMRDADVLWLRKSLTSIQGTPVEPMNLEFFDDVLEARVREYQASHNLAVDGLVGPQTQILIAGDLGSDGPRLNGTN